MFRTTSRFFAAALALCASWLPAELDAQFADSLTVTELAEDLYLLEGALDLIVVSTGEDGTLMVDAGYAETEGRVRDALARIGAGPPNVLINTHWHHTFANEAFGQEALVVAHRSVLERGERAQPMFARTVPPLPPHARPEVLVDDSLTLRFNGREVRLLHLPDAHTDGDLAVFFPDAGVVMTGDVAVAHMPWTDPDAGGRFDALLAAVERLRALVPEDAVMVPGHGAPFGRDTLDLYARMLTQTADRVRERIARGWSLDDVVAEGVDEGWGAWEGGVPEALFLASVYRAYGPEDGAPPPPAIRFEGGRWWDGKEFRKATWTSVGGRLTLEPVEAADSVIDLAGGYVVPSFGEAHTHRLGDPEHLDVDHAELLRAGVHYAMVQDPAHVVGARMRELSAAREAVDVGYTQGVITPSWGVIARFYEMMAERGHYGSGVTVDSVRDRLFFEVDDAADLAEKWPAIRARNDDFVKVILAFSEEHAERRARPDRYGAEPPRYSALPGLDPALLPELVRRAREAESVFAEVHRHNLRVLREAGARLALGSDAFRGTVVDEVAYLDRLGVFERAELLNLLTGATPRAVFPDRRIGALGEGLEASFVVLEADPAADLSPIRRIRLAVKKGLVVGRSSVPDSAGASVGEAEITTIGDLSADAPTEAGGEVPREAERFRWSVAGLRQRARGLYRVTALPVDAHRPGGSPHAAELPVRLVDRLQRSLLGVEVGVKCPDVTPASDEPGAGIDEEVGLEAVAERDLHHRVVGTLHGLPARIAELVAPLRKPVQAEEGVFDAVTERRRAHLPHGLDGGARSGSLPGARSVDPLAEDVVAIGEDVHPHATVGRGPIATFHGERRLHELESDVDVAEGVQRLLATHGGDVPLHQPIQRPSLLPGCVVAHGAAEREGEEAHARGNSWKRGGGHGVSRVRLENVDLGPSCGSEGCLSPEASRSRDSAPVHRSPEPGRPGTEHGRGQILRLSRSPVGSPHE